MKTLLKLGVVAMLVTVTLLSVNLISYAQGPRGVGMGGPQNSLVAVAAKTLGMTQTELVAALQGGKSIADVAKDKGVVVDKIVDALVASRQETLKASVASGRFTQAQADTMLGFMRANLLTQISKPFTPQGPGFADADHDGMCDNCANGAQVGRMGGRMGGSMGSGPRRGR